jgi:hypothetical protein
MINASVMWSHDLEAFLLTAILVLFCMIGAGGKIIRRWIGAELPVSHWLRAPAKLLLARLAPVFVVSFVFYPVGWTWSALARNMSQPYFLRTLAYAALIELPAVCLVTWGCVRTVSWYVNRWREPGAVEIHGTVVEGARVIGEPGEAKRWVAFVVESDTGERLHVDLQPVCVWPTASLAQGLSVRRVAPTHPSALPWLGLHVGERVWLVGASPLAGDASRLVVAETRAILVRGGPAAAYTAWLPMAVILWVLVRYIHPVAWLTAVAFDDGRL